MVLVVGIVGGTRGQGRAIVEELKKVPKLYVTKIFSRKVNHSLSKSIGAPIVPINFDDAVSIAEVFEREAVHTVISTIGMISEDAHRSEVNLLRAAELSKSVKRFVPSTFDVPYDQEMADVLYTGQYKLDLERQLMMTTSLEWTRYHNGFYMDYFFSSSMPTNLTPGKYVIDLDKKRVIVPGDGDKQVTFTHTTDVAKFVVASLSLPIWPTRQFIIGDQLSWNNFVDRAERISGEKFQRQSNSIETLRAGDIEQFKQLHGWEVLYDFWSRSLAERLPSAIQWFMATGRADLRDKAGFVLNEQFQEIKPLTIEDALQDFYAQSSSSRILAS